MIDFSSVLFLILLHLSYIGLGLRLGRCWPAFQKSSGADAENLSRCEALFKHWALGVFVAMILLCLASLLHFYWIGFWLITLLGLGSLLICCRMQQGRTAAGRRSYLKNLPLIAVIVFFSVCLFILYANLSLVHQVHGVSGMGNWALKSKIIFLESGLHSSYFDHATHY
jgi:hypothetical protein